MKIAFVIPGGFERPDRVGPTRELPVWNTLISRLSANHDIHVFCTDFDEVGGNWLAGRARVHDPGKVPRRVLPGLRTLERIARTGRLIAREHRRGGFDVIHAAWIDANGLAAALAARALGVPLIASIAGGECVWFPEIPYGNAATPIARATTRFTLNTARAATVTTEYARAWVLSSSSRAIEVIPLGPDRATFLHTTDRPTGPPWRLINVADLNPVKDHKTLLLALRILTDRGVDASLHQYGFDTRGGEAQRLAKELKLEARTTFYGRTSQAVIANALAESHLHVISSRFESQCVAVAEAALAGTPTVGSHVGLLADLSPTRAVTATPGDPLALANAIEDILRSVSKRLATAAAAQDWAVKHDADWCERKYSELYARVSGRNAKPDLDIVANA